MYKFVAGFFAVMAVCLITLASARGGEMTGPSCTPFSMKEVPDENAPGWEFIKERIFDEYGASQHQFKTDSGFRLGVWYYFGIRGMKAWACDPIPNLFIHDVPGHQISILLEDDKWSAPVYAQSPKSVLVYKAAVLEERFVYLEDENGRVVASRTFARQSKK